MISLYDGEIIDLLPEPFKSDPDVIAISYAIKRAVGVMLENAKKLPLYSDIDHMPEYILDYMAVETNLAYYDESFDIATKRKLVKDAYISRMTAGTRAATEDIIKTIFGGGEIVEWYEEQENPGEPGTFDVKTEARMTDKLYEQLTQAISRTKNCSSHMRYVSIMRELHNELKEAAGTTEHVTQTLSNDVRVDAEDNAIFRDEFIGVWESAGTSESMCMDMPHIKRDETIDASVLVGLTQHKEYTFYERLGSAEIHEDKPELIGVTQHRTSTFYESMDSMEASGVKPVTMGLTQNIHQTMGGSK